MHLPSELTLYRTLYKYLEDGDMRHSQIYEDTDSECTVVSMLSLLDTGAVPPIKDIDSTICFLLGRYPESINSTYRVSLVESEEVMEEPSFGYILLQITREQNKFNTKSNPVETWINNRDLLYEPKNRLAYLVTLLDKDMSQIYCNLGLEFEEVLNIAKAKIESGQVNMTTKPMYRFYMDLLQSNECWR